MTTRNRRKREQKPSKRWREFMWVKWRAASAANRVVNVNAWWEADNNGMPSFASGIDNLLGGTDTQRHAL